MSRPALPAPVEAPEGGVLDAEGLYGEWFDEVVRWARALGAPDGDLEDVAQEVFVVVRRHLPRFDGRNVAGWLYTITARTVSDLRRRAWWRRVFRRGAGTSDDLDEIAAPGRGPEEHAEAAEARRLVERLLHGMSDKRRATFVLFEIEGYSGAEIAALQGVPEKTVWSRLHHARREFLERCRAEGFEAAVLETRGGGKPRQAIGLVDNTDEPGSREED